MIKRSVMFFSKNLYNLKRFIYSEYKIKIIILEYKIKLKIQYCSKNMHIEAIILFFFLK